MNTIILPPGYFLCAKQEGPGLSGDTVRAYFNRDLNKFMFTVTYTAVIHDTPQNRIAQFGPLEKKHIPSILAVFRDIAEMKNPSEVKE